MDLEHAGQTHNEWKIKLRTAIAKHEHVDVNALSADNHCPLGVWLHGDAKAKYGSLASYPACVAAHKSFHQEAGKVAREINGKNFDHAKAMMDANSPYALAANAFIVAIGLLKKEAGL